MFFTAAMLAISAAQAYNSHKQGKKAQKRADRIGHDANQITGSQYSRDLGFFEQYQNQDKQRLIKGDYQGAEDELNQKLREGVNVEGAAGEAEAAFNTSFDRAADAQQRDFARRGGQQNSGAAARLAEDEMMNRAIGGAAAANQARTAADDLNFARQTAYVSQGQALRNSIYNQQGNLSALANNRAAVIQGQAGQQQAIANQHNANFQSGVAGMGTALGGIDNYAQAAGGYGALLGKKGDIQDKGVPGTVQGTHGTIQSNSNQATAYKQYYKSLQQQQAGDY